MSKKKISQLNGPTVHGTLEAKDVLLLYREPGVLKGYIPSNKSWTYYLYSTLHVNNETVNVWTHSIGLVLIAYNFYYHVTEKGIGDDPRLTPLIGFVICSLLNVFLSCVAHTFHFKSPFIHYTAYQADYAGIGFYSLGAGMLTFYFSCRQDWSIYLTNSFMLVNFVLSWFGFLCSSIAKLLYRRPYPLRRKLWNICSFGMQFLFSYTLVLSRLDDYNSFSTLYDHVMVMCLIMGGAIFFSSHLPERIWPGKFDIIGQGHHIFHVSSIVLSLKQFQTAYKDYIEYKGALALQPSLPFILAYIALFGAACILTILVLRRYVERRITEDMKYE